MDNNAPPDKDGDSTGEPPHNDDSTPPEESEGLLERALRLYRTHTNKPK